MVRNIDGQGLSALSSLIAASGTVQQPDTTPSPRTLLGNNKFIGDVEKHLDDVQKGKGYLSKEVNKAIFEKQFASGSELANLNPRLSTLYNGFSTGLTYSKNARFVSGVNQAVNTFGRLLDLYS